MAFGHQYPDYRFGNAWNNGGLRGSWYVNDDEGSIPMHLIPLSRWMARFLRHEAKINADGWFKLKELMDNPYMHKHSLNDVHLVVQESYSGTRPRFEIRDPYIRATHKHSVRRSGEDSEPPRKRGRPPQGTTTDVDKDSSNWSWWIKKEPKDEGEKAGDGESGAKAEAAKAKGDQFRKVPRHERHNGARKAKNRWEVKAENSDDDNTSNNGGGTATGSTTGSSFSNFGVQNAGSATGPLLGTVMKPLPPPGEYWTPYDDQGTGWWMYEGPLGKWWCMNEGDTLMRYEDSPDGDASEA